MALVLAAAPPAAAADKVEVGLEIAGRSDLGGRGPFDDVAVVGRTAVVATGDCPGSSLTVVDVGKPKKPSVVATVPLRAGTVAADVDAQPVATESFTGDLLAVALSTCGGTGVGVAYYDISAPAAPRLLSEQPGAGLGSVAIAARDGGGVIAVRPLGTATLTVDDITDPTRPAAAGRWSPPSPAVPGGCGPGQLQVAGVHGDGQGALVVSTDGRVYDLDLSDPARPSDGGPVATGARGRYGGVMPVGRRTLAIVTDAGPDGACPEGPGPGLRVLQLSRGAPPSEVEPVQFTTRAPPGRLVASGELAYVAWQGEGLRVVDMGAVKPAVTAQFIPERPAVVAVALLDEHVVVIDRNAGLYVLERPDEGGPNSTWWTNVVGLLPYLLFAVLLTALLVLPRLAVARVRARSGVPSPMPEGVRRRRA